MRMVDWKNKSYKGLLCSSLVMLVASSSTFGMTEQDYKNALKIVSEKVARTQQSGSANALSSPIIKAYFGRYYKVGDSWDVASWEIKNPMLSYAPIAEGQSPKVGKGGVFHYEVKEVRNGTTPQVVISVKQISDFGMTPVDPKVEELTLTMSDRLVQTEKAYRLKGSAEAVKVSPDGLHSRITPIELYALDVPEIATAIKNTPSSLPELPATVQSVASRAGYQPVLNQSTWLEQDDFFGRPVQILWQYGNPWPSYLKTSSGMSILLRSNVNGRAS
ncbi:MAG: hypothetical protein ACJ763_02855 [Bdellovibrionia bacterium]